LKNKFPSLKVESLKSLFIKEIEAKIISGELKPGDRLPPERDLASQMGISRSIINSGILELAAKGFVAIKPRKGTIVVDYKNEGTAQILASIMNYNQEKFDIRLFSGMMDTRLLIEVESARCAAQNRTDEDLKVLKKLLEEIAVKPSGSVCNFEEFNYQFHHRVTIASGNIVFAMIFKSFEPVCRSLIRIYYETGGMDFQKKAAIHYERLYMALLDKKSEIAAKSMEDILLHGKNELTRIIYTKNSLFP